MNLRETVWGFELNLTSSEYRPIAGSREHGNEATGFIKAEDGLISCEVFTDDHAPRR
jgi:hypothetical protein